MQYYNYNKVHNNKSIVVTQSTYPFAKINYSSTVAAGHLIDSYFADTFCYVSSPTFHFSHGRVVVQVFYYKANGSNKAPFYANRTLGTALSQLFSTPMSVVGVELRLVRVHQPYLNSKILAHYLSTAASKYGFARLRSSIISAIPLHVPFTGLTSPVSGPISPSSIVGVKIQLSGLLTTQRNAPRQTVSTVSVGVICNSKNHVEYASSTSKSSVGAFTVKVWICTS